MPEWIVVFYPINSFSAYVLYIFLYNRRKQIGFHLGMNITMVAAGGCSRDRDYFYQLVSFLLFGSDLVFCDHRWYFRNLVWQSL